MKTRMSSYIVIIILVFLAGYYSGGQTILQPSVSSPAPHVTTITVPVPVITERVIRVLIDPKDSPTVNALLRENKKLRVTVHDLSITIAEYESRGEGPIIVSAPTVSPSTTPTPPVNIQFKDWRLEFSTNANTAHYTLRQRFSVMNTVGKNKRGVPTHLVRLYELGPNDERLPITTMQTTTIAADPDAPSWMFAPRVTAGVAYVNRVSNGSLRLPTTQTTPLIPTGVIAISWLRFGRSMANEDTRWSLLSPAATITDTDKSIGILPVSFNFGTLPKQPFTNLWLSPYIGTTTGTSINRLGLSLTATF